ncbi:helix-turn-helix domain-containing protein [Carnimonas bestiolae]|uniref:helix-turn-helix domain-containing protein n=1 Tax=Carnimonas bestiolae TaxID=3402172 RepID=UPI003EDC58F9
MSEHTSNVQVFSGLDGRPAYVVMPYADYLAHFKEEKACVPQDVVEKQVLENMSPIAAWRRHLGITQVEMAQRLNMSQGSYAGIEKSQRPHKATLDKVASALGIDVEQLVY